MFYALILDSDGNVLGPHAYVEQPSTYPSNEVACTAAQAANPSAWSFVAGELVESIPAAQAAQIALLTAAYQAAIVQPVSYTSVGGVTASYQADLNSVANLTQMLLAFSRTQTVPSGFYWVCGANTQVPFTYADLQGLAAALGTQGNAAFQQLQTLKAQVLAATTVAAIQAIVWPTA
jgi:hypothetical protein